MCWWWWFVLFGCNLVIFNDIYIYLKKFYKYINWYFYLNFGNKYLKWIFWNLYFIYVLKKIYFYEYMIVNDIFIEFYKEYILMFCIYVIKNIFVWSIDEVFFYSFFL